MSYLIATAGLALAWIAQLSSPNFLYQYFSISLLVFQVLEVAYLDRDAA